MARSTAPTWPPHKWGGIMARSTAPTWPPHMVGRDHGDIYRPHLASPPGGEGPQSLEISAALEVVGHAWPRQLIQRESVAAR